MSVSVCLISFILKPLHSASWINSLHRKTVVTHPYNIALNIKVTWWPYVVLTFVDSRFWALFRLNGEMLGHDEKSLNSFKLCSSLSQYFRLFWKCWSRFNRLFFTFLSSHQLSVSTCFLRNDVINMSRARDKEKISDRNFHTLVECCNYWARRDPWRGGSWIEGSGVWHASCVLTTIHKGASLTFHSSLPCHKHHATGQTGIRSTKYMRCYLGKRKKWNWTICWPQIRDDQVERQVIACSKNTYIVKRLHKTS